MSQTTVNLGYVPASRGEYSASVKYYKDNIVQYNGSAYIAKPTSTVNDGSEGTGANTVYYLTRAPYESNASTLNAGWETFASVGFIDNEPTSGSDNLVKSGGVKQGILENRLYIQPVFFTEKNGDISVLTSGSIQHLESFTSIKFSVRNGDTIKVYGSTGSSGRCIISLFNGDTFIGGIAGESIKTYEYTVNNASVDTAIVSNNIDVVSASDAWGFVEKASDRVLKEKVDFFGTENTSRTSKIDFTYATSNISVLVADKSMDVRSAFSTIKINVSKGDEIHLHAKNASDTKYMISIWSASDEFIDGVAGSGANTEYILSVDSDSASYALVTNWNEGMQDSEASVYIISSHIFEVTKPIAQKVQELDIEVNNLIGSVVPITTERHIGILNSDGTTWDSPSTSYQYRYTGFIPVSPGETYKIKGFVGSGSARILAGYTSENTNSFVSDWMPYTPDYSQAQEVTFVCPANISYIIVCYNTTVISDTEDVAFHISEGEIEKLDKKIDDSFKDIIGDKIPCTWNLGWVLPDGTFNVLTGGRQIYSSFIPLKKGKKYHYIGSQGTTGRLVLALYSGNTESSFKYIVSDAVSGSKVEGDFICPEDVSYAIVGTNTDYADQDIAGIYEYKENAVKDVLPNEYGLKAVEVEHNNLKVRGSVISPYIHARRPLVTFVLDGAYDRNPTIVNIFNTFGFKLGVAPGKDNVFYNSGSTVLYQLWMSQGHDIMIHGNTDLSEHTSLTDEEAAAAIKNAYDISQRYMFNSNGYLSLAGSTAERFIPIIKKYFDFGFTYNNKSGSATPQYLVFESDSPYKMWRYGMQDSTLQQMKDAVDATIINNGLLVFYTHARTDAIGGATDENINALLTYIQSKVDADLIQEMSPSNCIKEYYAIRYDDIVNNQ